MSIGSTRGPDRLRRRRGTENLRDLRHEVGRGQSMSFRSQMDAILLVVLCGKVGCAERYDFDLTHLQACFDGREV